MTASGVRSRSSRSRAADSSAGTVETSALGQWLVTWCVSHCRRLVSPPTTNKFGPVGSAIDEVFYKERQRSAKDAVLACRDFTFWGSSRALRGFVNPLSKITGV